jgi:hypothetical protein
MPHHGMQATSVGGAGGRVIATLVFCEHLEKPEASEQAAGEHDDFERAGELLAKLKAALRRKH